MATDENNIEKLGIIEINVLTNGTDLMREDTSLQWVNCPFPKLENGTQMFYKCTALQTFATNYDNDEKDIHMSFNKLQTGTRMFQGCTSLTRIESRTPKLTHAQHMFRDCTSLTENSIAIENIQDTLIDGLATFQGTSFTTIPWTFPNLVRSRQMFRDTQISGHLQLDMGRQFPKVSKANLEESGITPQYPASQMFYGCPITSINFDVSSLDEGISMFAFCKQLTKCTGAVFQEGGNYQSMFTESRFDLESALLIFNAAKAANVSALHIGIDSQLTDDHEFVIDHQLVRYQQGYDEQWMTQSGNVIFVCHPTDVQTAFIDDTNHAPTID